jgi:hypothetical protein
LLDGLLACTYWGIARGTSPMQIFQSVSAGLLGREAYSGGPPTAWLGVGLHLFIAVMMAAAYGLAAQQWPELTRAAPRGSPAWPGLVLRGDAPGGAAAVARVAAAGDVAVAPGRCRQPPVPRRPADRVVERAGCSRRAPRA